jgi:glycosyltransferase involved in cell wall biosynthesis
MKILTIIPSYNEEEIIIDLVKEFKKNTNGIDYIVINDASTDRTKQLLKLNNIIHMNLPVNLGLTGATRVGMEYAYENDYDYAIKIDGDGQHDPRAINYMLTTMINNDCDVVQMSRFKTKKKKFFSARMMGSRLISFCS